MINLTKTYKKKGLIVMARMKNEDVIKNFVEMNGECSNHSESLYIYGNKLINYSTTIAQWTKKGLVINDTKYSQTTTKLQNMVKRMSNNYITVSNIHEGAYDLSIFVNDGIEIIS